jgi:hypothetical protein
VESGPPSTGTILVLGGKVTLSGGSREWSSVPTACLTTHRASVRIVLLAVTYAVVSISVTHALRDWIPLKAKLSATASLLVIRGSSERLYTSTIRILSRTMSLEILPKD